MRSFMDQEFDDLVRSVEALLDAIESQTKEFDSNKDIKSDNIVGRNIEMKQSTIFFEEGKPETDKNDCILDMNNQNLRTAIQSIDWSFSSHTALANDDLFEMDTINFEQGAANHLNLSDEWLGSVGDDSFPCQSISRLCMRKVKAKSIKTNGNTTKDSVKSQFLLTGPFPRVLYELLENSEKEGYVDLVSWQRHGRAFRVHNPKQFVASIMPLYFHQTRYTSFQRQLSLYGFVRIKTGKDRGAYYHEHFVRGCKSLCLSIQRTPVKSVSHHIVAESKADPNFYTI
jgi:HSF-type DNA-binding